MGSVSYHTERGVTTKENITQYLVNDCGIKVVDLAVKGSVGYAACENPDHPGDGVFALVCLTSNRASEYHNFNIKIVGEEMGPVEADCPARILDLLSPIENPYEGNGHYASQWRQRCRFSLAQAAEAKGVKPGSKVRFAKAMDFTNGESYDTFTFVKGSAFLAGSIPVRITNWRKRDFELVAS